MRYIKIYIMLLLCILLVGCEHKIEEERKEKTALSTPATFEDKIKISVKNDEGTGYPHGNMGEYQRFICSDAEWLYVVQNKSDGSCRLIRLRKDGTDKKCIYENKRGKIFCLNAKNNRLVFLLSEGGKDNIKSRKDSICKIKSNGSEFEKLEEVRVNDLWLYKNRIYYSSFTKWSGRNIYSMDMNGEDEKVILEKEDGIEFEVINDKIYVFYYENSHEIISGCELYQMNLDGTEKEKLLDIAEAYWDTICLWEDSVYYLNEDKHEENQLCRMEINGGKEIVIASDVRKYCISGKWIYFVTDFAGPTKLYKVNEETKELVLVKEGKAISNGQFDVIIDNMIYFESDDKALTRINCGDGKEEIIELNKN